MSMQIRLLSLEEVCDLTKPLIEKTNVQHSKQLDNANVRWAILMHKARHNTRVNGATGVYGLFRDRLEVIMCASAWKPLPYYVLDSLRSIANDVKSVLLLSEHIVGAMERKGYYSFYYARTVKPHDLEKKKHTLLLAPYVFERYDIVVEKMNEMGRKYSTLTDIGINPDTIVYKLSLKNTLRPYVVVPQTIRC